MIKISFLGDVMLGRFVAEQYRNKPYNLVDQKVIDELLKTDVRIANLESPISSCETEDSLRFAADKDLLEQFKWVDCFSLSNNHINDFGTQGMKETIEALDDKQIEHNGLYTEAYAPYLIEKGGERIAVVTCADMMNYEFHHDCPYKTLRVNSPDEIMACIMKYKEEGYFVMVYAHVGMLFTRYPNPIIRDFVHQMVDWGADCVVTAHPHCLGGAELYKDKLIVYSLGDFLMDGSSYRRRRSGILNISITDGVISEWNVVPVFTDNHLMVRIPDSKTKGRMLKDFNKVSKRLKKYADSYLSFYKRQYKIELVQHSLSTVHFEYDRRGLLGLIRILRKRGGAVRGMTKRVVTDRSSMSYDPDAVSEHNISIKDIR